MWTALTPLPRQSLLPPTDSRFNPAQRALEEGDFDRAEACKAKQEAAQRARKAARDEAGETWNPRWFVEEAEGMWRYKGGYWLVLALDPFFLSCCSPCCWRDDDASRSIACPPPRVGVRARVTSPLPPPPLFPGRPRRMYPTPAGVHRRRRRPLTSPSEEK